MHNINKSRVSLLNMLKGDHPGIAQGQNIFVVTKLVIATLFDRVLKVRKSKLLRAYVLT